MNNPKCPVPECGTPMANWTDGRLTCLEVGCRGYMTQYQPSLISSITIAPLPKPAPALKPCPACNSSPKRSTDGKSCWCANDDCELDDVFSVEFWQSLPRRGEYADNLIVFEKTGETRKARRGEWRELSDGLIRSWDSESQSAHEFPILRRIHPPEPRPETKPAERIPWPEWATGKTEMSSFTVDHECRLLMSLGTWRLNWEQWPYGEGTYRRVTVDGKDFAEKVGQ